MIHEFKTVKELRWYLKDDKIILAKKDFVYGVGKGAEHYSTDDCFLGYNEYMVENGDWSYEYKVSRDIFIKAIEEIEMEQTKCYLAENENEAKQIIEYLYSIGYSWEHEYKAEEEYYPRYFNINAYQDKYISWCDYNIFDKPIEPFLFKYTVASCEETHNNDSKEIRPHKHKELIEKWVKDTNQKVWCWGDYLNKWFVVQNPDWQEKYKYLVQEDCPKDESPNIPEIPKYVNIKVNGVSVQVLNVDWLKENENTVVCSVNKATGNPALNIHFRNFLKPENNIFFEHDYLLLEFLESVDGNDTYTVS